MVRAARPASPSSIRTTRSPRAGARLGGQELKHIGDRHLRRRLGYHPEKDLQIRRHRQPRVGPGPGAHEDEVLVKQRVAQSDGPKVAAFEERGTRQGVKVNGLLSTVEPGC